jgi:hypothetical protein
MTTLDNREDLEAAAADEIERACTLGWKELARVTPWGDSFEGFAPSGLGVTFERNYLWADEPGQDILVEVVVYEPQAYEAGVTLTRRLQRREEHC